MKYLLGVAEKYHVVGRYGGHKWHGFWLKVLDAREAFPLRTRFMLARLFEANNLASLNLVLRGNASRASKTVRQHPCHLCPPYLPTTWYFPANPSKYFMCYL